MNVGETWGNREILEQSSERTLQTWRSYKRWRFSYVCRCTCCGHIETCTEQHLYDAKRHNYKHCSNCRDFVTRTGPRTSGRRCGVCYWITDRRPLVGPCKCGEYYEPEVIEGFSLQRNMSSIAVFHRIIA